MLPFGPFVWYLFLPLFSPPIFVFVFVSTSIGHSLWQTPYIYLPNHERLGSIPSAFLFFSFLGIFLPLVNSYGKKIFFFLPRKKITACSALVYVSTLAISTSHSNITSVQLFHPVPFTVQDELHTIGWVMASRRELLAFRRNRITPFCREGCEDLSSLLLGKGVFAVPTYSPVSSLCHHRVVFAAIFIEEKVSAESVYKLS